MSGGRAARAGLALAAAAALALGAGCSSQDGLGGVLIPNALPDTRVTGTPPNLRHAECFVHFFWDGSDPDGELRGFQWKLSDNGLDGISVVDTLTIDPATGDTLHPWHFTTAGDTTFTVTADLPGFPDDEEIPAASRRSYQTHSLFVRAVDDLGAVDPTPAMISFTATTLTPSIAVSEPVGLAGRRDWADAPPNVALLYTGSDPDYELGVPVRVRYLWKEARYGPCDWITSEYDWRRYGELVLTDDDSNWSNWLPYPPRAEKRRVDFPNQRELDTSCPLGRQKIGYIFAIQAMDTAGAVTPFLTYGVNLINLKITKTQSPLLTIRERYLGSQQNNGTGYVWGVLDIAENQPLEFSWSASASGYAGIVSAYRYGWDVADVTNEDDPGWRVGAGMSAAHLRSPVTKFASGLHTLTVEAWDNSGQLARIRVELNVVPVPDRERQAPVLLVDDVVDKASNAWVVNGIPYDKDAVRDRFWLNVLDGDESVQGFLPSAHVADLEEVGTTFGYAWLVNFRSLIWAEKKGANSFVNGRFSRQAGERYVWLGSYQRLVGNVLMCGQQAMSAFVGDGVTLPLPSGGSRTLELVMPLIFDTSEQDCTCASYTYAMGWGERETADGGTERIGPTLYPPNLWGIAALDQTGTLNNVYGCVGLGSTSRRSNCAGLKGVLLDPAFRMQYLDAGAIADTILTWRTLDAADYPQYPGFPDLARSFLWNLDEFYDLNITSRPTPVVPQVRADGSPMIEPMFRYYARYDWIDDIYARRGVPAWPDGYFDTDALKRHCGRQILGLSGRTKVAGAPVGILSHKTEDLKPGGRGDILWGFDPSRFEQVPITRAIRWVLRDQFGLRFSSGARKDR